MHQRFRRSIRLLGLPAFLLCRVLMANPAGDALAEEKFKPDPCAFFQSGPSFKLTAKQLSTSLWAREIVAAKIGDKVLHQDTNDLDTLYREAVVADRELKQIIRKVADCTGGTAVFSPGGGLKRRKRAAEKIEVELGGNASALMDIARGAIEYADIDQVYQALFFIMRHGYDVVRVKDRALTPLPSGFWDIHLNLRMPSGHIVELQLHYKEIRQYSMGEGHKHYVRIREMKSRAFHEGRALNRAEREIIDRLNCEQRRFYQAAFERGQKNRELQPSETTPCID